MPIHCHGSFEQFVGSEAHYIHWDMSTCSTSKIHIADSRNKRSTLPKSSVYIRYSISSFLTSASIVTRAVATRLLFAKVASTTCTFRDNINPHTN